MQKTQLQLPEIKLVGIKTRTNNQYEQIPGKAKIAALVQAYYENAVAAEILNRVTPGKTYIVYSEYESNFEGDYTCFIGEEVSSFENISASLSEHIIPAQQYYKFISKPGKMPEIIIKSWGEIWQMKDLEEIRSYKADFEVYDLNSFDPENARAEILIGINN